MRRHKPAWCRHYAGVNLAWCWQQAGLCRRKICIFKFWKLTYRWRWNFSKSTLWLNESNCFLDIVVLNMATKPTRIRFLSKNPHSIKYQTKHKQSLNKIPIAENSKTFQTKQNPALKLSQSLDSPKKARKIARRINKPLIFHKRNKCSWIMLSGSCTDIHVCNMLEHFQKCVCVYVCREWK